MYNVEAVCVLDLVYRWGECRTGPSGSQICGPMIQPSHMSSNQTSRRTWKKTCTINNEHKKIAAHECLILPLPYYIQPIQYRAVII